MPIDKLIPRQLTPDADSKLVRKTSFLDALNIYSGDYEEGNQGVLKNIKGNKEVSGSETLPDDARIIGKVEDVRTGLVYFFVYSEDAAEQGVWVYDAAGALPDSEPHQLSVVYKSPVFNFPQNGFVKGDVVYTNAVRTFEGLGVDFEKDAIIYFTDGVNEPRKINAYRAYSVGSQIHGDPADLTSDENLLNEADFITACPKTPLIPITFEFVASQDENRTSNDFVGTRGFQFAYQYIYTDGMESAISPYSDVAFPPSVLEQGASSYVDHSEFNECQLTVPLPGAEIDSVRILCRQGNVGSFLVIEQVDAEGFDGLYRFYNDKVLSGVSTDEVNKQFDSVPRKAVAQTTSSNRLFYGNYLDGFDNVDVEATSEVVYHPRDEDFISFDVKFFPSITPNEGHVEGEPIKGKTTAFVLDCTELPNTMSAGTVVNATITLSPDRNWHIYRFPNNTDIDGGSFHQSNQIGPEEQGSINNNFDGANNPSFTVDQLESVTGAVHSFARNTGVGGAVSWIPAGQTSGDIQALYGTTALNPLILKGAGITFSAKIRATALVENARIKVNQAIRKCFIEEEDENLDLSNDNFELVERSHRPSYSYNLGLGDGDLIQQSFLNENEPSSDLSKLLVAVNSTTRLLDGTVEQAKKPIGAFIVNSATPKFKAFLGSDEYIIGDAEKSHIGVTLQSIEGVEVHTCIHEIPLSDKVTFSNLPASSWVVVTKETLESSDFLLSNFLSGQGLSTQLNFTLAPTVIDEAPTVDESFGQAIANNQLSYLKPLTGDDFFVGGNEICLFDGEGGPGGGPAKNTNDSTNGYDVMFMYNQGSITVNPYAYIDQNNVVRYSYSETFYFEGEAKVDIAGSLNAQEAGGDSAGAAAKNMPLAKPAFFTESYLNYLSPEPDDQDFSILASDSVNFKRLHSYVEILSGFASILPPENEANNSSFKTEASHDFGIVYYDERGRHGFVNPIESVYVEGYSPLERSSNNQGRVSIKLTLTNTPPDWAHFYKVVYAKNTSVKDFVQYNAGGAFLASNEEQDQDVSNTNIFVSLNYLQGHPISYVSSFGARTPEGGLNFYKFEPGDRLRVISYAEGDTRQYPQNLEFEVVDFVKLGGESNPLSNEPEENQKGDFVVIKNNPNAGGFTFQDVAAGTSEWGNNCIIELRTPLKELEEDQRLYYEIGPTGNIGIETSTGELQHVPAQVELTQGDVWFRRVAVNVRDLEDGVYPDLIIDDDGDDDPSRSNFKNVYLETSTATDLYQADSISIGRPNVILEGAKETVREATISYSDPSNPESTKVNYASFNASLGNFKDLPEKYNSIQYLGDHGDSIFCLQKDKTSRIPVNRSIIATAGGGESIIASRNVLNEEIYYAGQNGCDEDPSSVSDIEGTVFFANRSLGTIYKYSRNTGVETVSDLGLSSFFRELFEDAIADIPEGNELRVVGGYDPVKKEYLVTTLNMPILSSEGVVLVDQRAVDGPVVPGDDDSNGTDGEGPVGPTQGGDRPDSTEDEETDVVAPSR